MKSPRAILLLLVMSLVFATLACRFSLEVPWNVNVPDVEISPEDVSAAATRAAVAAATAAAMADQAGQLAATAVLQGDTIVSTAVAGEGLSDLGAAVGAAGSLEEKLNNIRPDANGNFTVTLTDADIAQSIADQGGTFANTEAEIVNLRVQFLPQHVLVAGDLTRPLQLPLSVELQPVVSDGELRFQIIRATAGLFPVPDSLLSTLELGVNAALSQTFNRLPAGVTLVDVALGNGSMTLLGQQR